ncbi:hypothetical protein PMIN01_10747 [Paraphaeosphaeria minitans]|uniref:Small secreted protein n=1 Tax=Paraphaeosphaeria minitans TaxID=565426 RepID=A0A9P6GB05_9PLEO|nr:hypothetical protein PMIN01_10747 [Paraphaeosphaeria minitans]
MKTSIILPLLASSIALAAPVSEIEKRANTAVYLCNDRNFSGYCVHIPSPSGTCVPLASDLNDLVSSVGPDQGSFCYFFVYSNANCDDTGGFFHVGYPGIADLSKTPVNGPSGSTKNFEDKLSSYRCTS